jgi:hypothetical protein
MKVWITTLAVVLSPVLSQGQAASTSPHSQYIPVPQAEQDIRQVQRDYFATTYALPLTVLTEAASKGTIDDRDTKDSLAVAESMDISLADIKTGAVAEIVEQPWSDFATIPDPGQDILYIDAENPNDTTHYGTVKAHWGPQEKQNVDPAAAGKTMQELLEPLNALNNTTFTRYVSYTVKVTFNGRSMKYKAFYLFAEDPRKHQIVDLHMTGPRYTDASGAYGPSTLLYSKLRDVPQIHDWILAHTTTDERCQSQNQLCCLTGHCLYRRSDFDRKFKMTPVSSDDVPVIPFAPGAASSFATALTSGCNSDSPPESCACSPISCIPLSPPYSTYPPAQCTVTVANRQVLIFGLVPTGKYHNWIVTIVHAAGMTNQDEILDGGPSNACNPMTYECGELEAAATPPPTGWQTGDKVSGGWYGSGFSNNACQAVFEIQTYTANFPFGIGYNLGGPNSNSYAYTATSPDISQLGYLPGTPFVGDPARDSPGWGPIK